MADRIAGFRPSIQGSADTVIASATKVVAASDSISTSRADYVCDGVADEVQINAAGFVQTLGKTAYLKVDGTTDIAVGDLLSTFTSAGIAKKASTGETAFAMALEAYTTNDSAGVIDALLIEPRVAI